MVRVNGEHDTTTRAQLSRTIAKAARLDDADVVVDLSGITFMDASTIGAIVDAHNRLRARSRSLSVRAPSRLARRLLDVCELSFLIDEHQSPGQPPVAPALDSWVAVPASDRDSDPAPTPVEQAPSQQTTRSAAHRRGDPAGSVQQRRAPS